MPPVNRVAHLLNLNSEPELPRRRQPPKQQLGTYVSTEVYDALLDFADATSLPITRIVEDALRAYLNMNYWKVGDDE